MNFTVILLIAKLSGSLSAEAETLTIPQTSYNRCITNKEAGACYELGWLYQNTSKPGDIALGNQYVRYGCKLETKKVCTQVLADQKSSLFLKQKKNWDAIKQKALSELPTIKSKDERDCERGKAQSCNAAGTHYFYLARFRNPAKGQAMFEHGCRLGDKPSCSSLELIKKGIVRVFDVEI